MQLNYLHVDALVNGELASKVSKKYQIPTTTSNYPYCSCLGIGAVLEISHNHSDVLPQVVEAEEEEETRPGAVVSVAAAAGEAVPATAAAAAVGPSTRRQETIRPAETERATAKEALTAGSSREGRAAGLPAAVLTPGPRRRRRPPRSSPAKAARLVTAGPRAQVRRGILLRRRVREAANEGRTTRSTTRATGATTSPRRRHV